MEGRLNRLLDITSFVLLIGTCTLLLFFVVPYIFQWYYIIYPLRIFLIITIITAIIILFYRLVIKSMLKQYIKNFILFLITFILILLLLEGIFMFIPRSHGIGKTLASRIYSGFYKGNINKLGYRDYNFDFSLSTNDKVKIVILGDSFTWGFGVRSEQRFTNLLNDKLSNTSLIFNLGKNGSDTKEEYKRLIDYPVKPNILILQYFLNDIEGASKENGQSVKGFSLYKDLNGLSEFMIRNSFILNYIYWLIPRGKHSTYIEFLSSAYNNQDILDSHLSDLDNILNYCKSNEITPYLIIIPFMNDLDLSHKLLTPIETHLIEQDIRFINFVDILKDIPIKIRMVNSNDGHMSAEVHKLVAEELYNMLHLLVESRYRHLEDI